VAGWLAAHIDHVRLTSAIEMRKLAHIFATLHGLDGHPSQ
jgi:hypothetical protein